MFLELGKGFEGRMADSNILLIHVFSFPNIFFYGRKFSIMMWRYWSVFIVILEQKLRSLPIYIPRSSPSLLFFFGTVGTVQWDMGFFNYCTWQKYTGSPLWGTALLKSMWLSSWRLLIKSLVSLFRGSIVVQRGNKDLQSSLLGQAFYISIWL